MAQVGQSQRSTHNFDAIAVEAYDESIPNHVMNHLIRRRVKVIVAAAASGKVLDVGCGTGKLLGQLSPDRHQCYGIDVSKGMLAQARRRYPWLEVNLASATDIPYDDETFDVVFSAAVLHHIAERSAVARAISEMIRVTRVGGTAVIWDHNPLNPYWPILMSRVPQDIGEERLIPRGEIQRTLKRLGSHYNLRVRWRQMTFIPDFMPTWLMPLAVPAEQLVEEVPLLRRISAHNVAIVAKRARLR